MLAIVSIVLRRQKVLGFTAITLVLISTALDGSQAQERINVQTNIYLGLYWFILSILFTGIVFIPIERLLVARNQPIFRLEWREDLLYFLISSLFVRPRFIRTSGPPSADREVVRDAAVPPLAPWHQGGKR